MSAMNDQTEDHDDPATDGGASGPDDHVFGPETVASRGPIAFPGVRAMAGPLVGVALVSVGMGFLLARNVNEVAPNAGLAGRTVTTPPPAGAPSTTAPSGAGRAPTSGGTPGSGSGPVVTLRPDRAEPVGTATGPSAGPTTGTTAATPSTTGGSTGSTGSTAATTGSTGSPTTAATVAPTAAPTTAVATGTVVTTAATATTTTAAATTTTTRPATTTTRAATTTTRPAPTTIAGSAYAAAVRASAPLAYWTLDEPSGGTAVDASPNGRSGVYAGGFLTNQAPAVRSGASVRFDTSGCVEVPDSVALRLNSAFTIELWARMDRFINTWPGLVVKGSAATADGYLVYYDRSGRVILKRNDVEIASAPGALRGDRFAHLAVTYDGSTVRWYVDGALSSSASASFPADNGTAMLSIGKGDEYGVHTIDEVAIYGSALPGSVLAAHVDAARR